MESSQEQRASSGGEPESSAAARSRERAGRRDPGTMLPRRGRRLGIETVFMRTIATAGVVGINVAVAAILDSQNVAGWIIGLVISTLSVVLAAILWSTREL
jgi:hypothetical protein